jgi:hypothetical protein
MLSAPLPPLGAIVFIIAVAANIVVIRSGRRRLVRLSRHSRLKVNRERSTS